MATVTDESVEVKLGTAEFLKFSGKTREQNLKQKITIVKSKINFVGLDDSAELNKNIQQLNIPEMLRKSI